MVDLKLRKIMKVILSIRVKVTLVINNKVIDMG